MLPLLIRVLAPAVLVVISGAAIAAPPPPPLDEGPPEGLSTVQSYDYAQRVDVNQVSMFVTNVGTFAWDLTTFNPGLEFPKGSGRTAVFAGGLWLGATVGGGVRVTVAEYSQEYQPGTMIAGMADSPTRPQYKVYKLNRSYPSSSERDAALADYAAGAVPYGAPAVAVLPDGTLGITGDQMLWSVFNDADPASHTNNAGGSQPLGVEVRQTTFAFNRAGPLGRVIYLHYKLINKGLNLLENMHVGLWMDPDLGGPTDDLVGCSPSRSLAYCYNTGGTDAVYGTMPPALGVDLIQGPESFPGTRLGLTAFSKFVNGTDPASPFESYYAMQGRLGDGTPIVDPTTGSSTMYFHAGDPTTGTGWLDMLGSDKRMLLASGPFTMAPGQEQEVMFALILGQQSHRLASLAEVLCDEPGVQAFAEAGFTGPEPVSGSCSVASACPRTANDWEREFDGGGDFSAQELQTIASCMDEKSTLFSLSGSVEAVRDLLDSGKVSDPAAAARREYTALLANACATELRLPPDAPVSLGLTDGVTCPGLAATYVSQLLETAERRVVAEYLDLNPTHRRALEGVNFGLAAFGGGADVGFNFFGSTLGPTTMPDSFTTVEVRFSHTAIQKAYRFVRMQTASGAAPLSYPNRGYLFRGFVDVPFQVWDVTHNVQLDAAFAERELTDDAGNRLIAGQLASSDSTWGPTDEATGDREYLFIYSRPYGDVPKAELAVDASIVNGTVPVLYAASTKLRTASDVIDDGDHFQLSFDYPPGPGVDGALIHLARKPQQDPAVVTAYRDISTCLQDVNAPDPGCGPPTPIRANAGADVLVECSSPEGTPVRLDGSASEGADLVFTWAASGITFDDPHAVAPTGSFPVGTTVVTLEVSRGGEVSRDEVQVTLVDTQAPSLEVTLTPALLWPPNHMLADIGASVVAQDACDGAPSIVLTSITSDEADSGLDDEDIPGDVQNADLGTSDYDFRLRAERGAEGDGRSYTVCYEARDASGNTTARCVTVDVPHDSRGRADLALSNGLWRLRLYGDGTMSARSVEMSSIVVIAQGLETATASLVPPVYSDLDGDGKEDVTVMLSGGLAAGQVSAGPLLVRWISGATHYMVEIAAGAVTDVQRMDLPRAFEAGARPNPAPGLASIHYALPHEGWVRVRVFDVTGREVARLVDGWVPAGRHVVRFEPHQAQLYLYRVEWDGQSLSGRLATIR